MSKKRTLNDRYIQSIPRTGERQQIPDDGCSNLWLLVQPSGKKTWAWRGRLRGKPAKLTLGPYPAHSLKDAREWAQGINRDRSGGIDPIEKKAREKAEAEAKAARALHSLNWLFDLYMTHEGGTRRTAARRRQTYDRELKPTIGGRSVYEIGYDDLSQVITAKYLVAPIAANRLHTLIARIFRWAVTKGRPLTGLTQNPAADLVKLAEESSRARFLSADEVRWLWLATETEEQPWKAAYRLLLLTSQRRTEVFGMTWSEVLGDLWTMEGDRTKNCEAHIVPLSTQARAVLAEVTRYNSTDFVFPAMDWGDADEEGVRHRVPVEGHASGYSKAQARILKRMQQIAEKERPGHVVPHWAIHDLRRTFSSLVAAEKFDVGDEVIDAVQNHHKGGMNRIYKRYKYLPEKRAALQAWADEVDSIIKRTVVVEPGEAA